MFVDYKKDLNKFYSVHHRVRELICLPYTST